jgi:uridine kinase
MHEGNYGAAMRRVVVGVAGGSGSGKSTVARRVAQALGQDSVALLDMDAYYRNFTLLSAAERRWVNWDHPDSLDTELFADHLSALASGRAVRKPVYDFVTHSRRDETVEITPREVIIADGILLLVEPRVRELCDVKVFVDAAADLCVLRRIQRDMRDRGRPLEEIVDQYLTTVRPMHLQFVEPSKRHADIIVPMGGHNDAAIDMIVSRIQDELRGAPA